MQQLEIKNHLKTSNNYVQLQIFRDNIKMITDYKKTRDFKNPFIHLKKMCKAH